MPPYLREPCSLLLLHSTVLCSKRGRRNRELGGTACKEVNEVIFFAHCFGETIPLIESKYSSEKLMAPAFAQKYRFCNNYCNKWRFRRKMYDNVIRMVF